MAVAALATIGSLCMIYFKCQHIDFHGTSLDASLMYAITDGRTTTDLDWAP